MLVGQGGQEQEAQRARLRHGGGALPLAPQLPHASIPASPLASPRALLTAQMSLMMRLAIS